MFHATLLSRYKRILVHGPAYAEPPPEIVNGEEEWEPEAIIKHRQFRGGHIKYMVQWKDWPPVYNSWEPKGSFENAKELLNAYRRLKGIEEDDESKAEGEEEAEDKQ